MCVVSTETDGCASTAQPISTSRPSLNGVEMRQPLEHQFPLHSRAISPSEGEGNKTGMSSARESELQQPFSSKVGSPLKKQQSVPANVHMVPNAPVPTESPAPSKPSADS